MGNWKVSVHECDRCIQAENLLLLDLVTTKFRFTHQTVKSPFGLIQNKYARPVQGFATARYFTSHAENLFDYQFAIN